MDKKIINYKLTSKTLNYRIGWAILLLSIFYTIGISLILFGFLINNQSFITNLPKPELEEITWNQWYLNVRGIGLFFLVFNIGLSLILCSYALKIRKYKKSNLKILLNLILWLIPIINLIYFFKNNTFRNYKSHQKKIDTWFENPENKNIQNNFWTVKYKILLAIFIMNLIMIPLILIWRMTEKYGIPNIWFHSLSFYTTQTNILLAIFSFIFVINPKSRIFKTDDTLILMCSYILIVGSIFCFVMFPRIVSGHWSKGIRETIFTSFFHVINPSIFCIFGIYSMKKWKSPCGYNINNLLFYGSIIPTSYLIYNISLPFLVGTSVYYRATNLNPDLLVNGKAGTLMLIILIPLSIFVFILYINIFNYLSNRKRNLKFETLTI